MILASSRNPERCLLGLLRECWDEALLDEKPVGGSNGQFEVGVTDVEVKKAVIGGGEVEKFAAVASPSHAAAEG